MPDWVTELFTGRFKVVTWFLLAVVFLYMPMLMFSVRLRNRRGANFLQQQPDAAKVRIVRGKMTGILTVRSVDGAEPLSVSEGMTEYFYLTPGEHVLALSYQWDEINWLGKLLPRYFEANCTEFGKDAKLRVTVSGRGKYRLGYDIEAEKYVFAVERENG